MATDNHIQALTALAARMFDHADSITQITLHDMESDNRLAACELERYASLRFAVAEIAAMTVCTAIIRTALLNALNATKE